LIKPDSPPARAAPPASGITAPERPRPSFRTSPRLRDPRLRAPAKKAPPVAPCKKPPGKNPRAAPPPFFFVVHVDRNRGARPASAPPFESTPPPARVGPGVGPPSPAPIHLPPTNRPFRQIPVPGLFPRAPCPNPRAGNRSRNHRGFGFWVEPAPRHGQPELRAPPLRGCALRPRWRPRGFFCRRAACGAVPVTTHRMSGGAAPQTRARPPTNPAAPAFCAESALGRFVWPVGPPGTVAENTCG